jgi:hypothetical protein
MYSVFTSSGTFTVPKGVKSIDVFCVGGGGGCYDACTAGGGGYTKTVKNISVTPKSKISVTVGAGSYAAGNETLVGSYCTAKGGYSYAYYSSGTSPISFGGSGGGGGVYCRDSSVLYCTIPGNGGSDGSDGKDYKSTYVYKTYESATAFINPSPNGKGQGTTTRYFGESNGTLYAGGGGGIARLYCDTFFAGDSLVKGYEGASGGAGGGGNACCNGSYATGGGAGGGPSNSFYYSKVSEVYVYGGSGVAIIRWGK